MIIGLIGDKGSGKTIVAKYLESKYEFQEYDLVTQIKKMAEIFGLSENDSDFVDLTLPEFIEICRKQLSAIWIKLINNFIQENENKNICIKNCQFLDKINNSILIEIIRPNHTKSGRFDIFEVKEDFKEPSTNYKIYNDGSIKELLDKVDQIIVEYLLEQLKKSS